MFYKEWEDPGLYPGYKFRNDHDFYKVLHYRFTRGWVPGVPSALDTLSRAEYQGRPESGMWKDQLYLPPGTAELVRTILEKEEKKQEADLAHEKKMKEERPELLQEEVEPEWMVKPRIRREDASTMITGNPYSYMLEKTFPKTSAALIDLVARAHGKRGKRGFLKDGVISHKEFFPLTRILYGDLPEIFSEAFAQAEALSAKRIYDVALTHWKEEEEKYYLNYMPPLWLDWKSGMTLQHSNQIHGKNDNYAYGEWLDFAERSLDVISSHPDSSSKKFKDWFVWLTDKVVVRDPAGQTPVPTAAAPPPTANDRSLPPPFVYEGPAGGGGEATTAATFSPPLKLFSPEISEPKKNSRRKPKKKSRKKSIKKQRKKSKKPIRKQRKQRKKSPVKSYKKRPQKSTKLRR